MTPMRRQLIQDLTIRGYSPHTIRNYVHYVYDLARYYRRPPQDLSESQIQSFLFYLATERKASWSTLNVAVSALRFFYHTTLKRPSSEVDLTIPRPRSGHRLPKWARKAGIKKCGSMHLLRHSFASHLLENGMDLTVIQQLLGHRNLCTTATYLHLTRNQKKQWVSPLDLLPPTLPEDFDSKD